MVKYSSNSRDMYQMYKKILCGCVIRILTPYDGSKNTIIKYFDDVPYLLEYGNVVALEGGGYGYANTCITQMFQLFDTSEYESQMVVSKGVYNWQGRRIRCYVYTLDDMPIYEIIDGKLDRLLLLFVIDPLAFISRMRHQIYMSSSKVQSFFNMLERNINDIMRKYLVKYFLMNQLKDKEVVNDVVLLVISSWIQLEIMELEKLKM